MGLVQTWCLKGRGTGAARQGRRSQPDDSGAAQPVATLDAERAAPEAAALREAGAAGEAGGGTKQPDDSCGARPSARLDAERAPHEGHPGPPFQVQRLQEVHP